MELKKTFIGIIVLSAVLAVLPQSAFGIGQTTDPVIINDALRGGTFQKEMIVINTDKEATVIAIESGGDIAGWVKFFKINDLKNPITSLIMKAGERSNLFAQITIPKDKKMENIPAFSALSKNLKAILPLPGLHRPFLKK